MGSHVTLRISTYACSGKEGGGGVEGQSWMTCVYIAVIYCSHVVQYWKKSGMGRQTIGVGEPHPCMGVAWRE